MEKLEVGVAQIVFSVLLRAKVRDPLSGSELLSLTEEQWNQVTVVLHQTKNSVIMSSGWKRECKSFAFCAFCLTIYSIAEALFKFGVHIYYLSCNFLLSYTSLLVEKKIDYFT